MPRISTTPSAPDEPGSGSAPAPAADTVPDPFTPIAEGAPLGIPIRVRGEDCPERIAIQSLIVGWYSEGFSEVLKIKPTEWAPVSKP